MAKHARRPGGRPAGRYGDMRPVGDGAHGSPYSSDAARYSRDAYGSGSARRYERGSYGSAGRRSGRGGAYGWFLAGRARRARRKRMLIVVLAVALAFALAAGIATGAYLHALGDAMALGEEGAAAALYLEKADPSKPYYVPKGSPKGVINKGNP